MYEDMNSISSLIYSSNICETEETTDYTDDTDGRNRITGIRVIRAIRGYILIDEHVMPTGSALVNNSG